MLCEYVQKLGLRAIRLSAAPRHSNRVRKTTFQTRTRMPTQVLLDGSICPFLIPLARSSNQLTASAEILRRVTLIENADPAVPAA